MKKQTSIFPRVRAGIFAVSLLLSSCSHQPPAARKPLRALTRKDLTAAEIKFGRGPKPDPDVEYQPEVVIVEGGAQTVRDLPSDGFTCVIDATAKRADELSLGKIAFVTDHCIGRILASKKDGDKLSLILGPFQLTDVFEKLNVDFDQPIDLSDALEYPAPQPGGLKYPLEGRDAVKPSFVSRMSRPSQE